MWVWRDKKITYGTYHKKEEINGAVGPKKNPVKYPVGIRTHLQETVTRVGFTAD
jgi:hypothetical protein